MPSWNDLTTAFDQQPEPTRSAWLVGELRRYLEEIGQQRGNRHVVFYASAFLQKPATPAAWIQLTLEEINGFMSCIHGMTWAKNLTLLLHTPGGVTNAVETIVSYLRSKFQAIEVIVPTLAMSAGTMISLAADHIVMGRQSQLGPIDPQFMTQGGALSARAVVDQFAMAKAEVIADLKLAHVWAPVLQSIGPALLQESQNALDYGESMVAKWLEQYMFAGRADAKDLAKNAARHFNDASAHKSHGRRIDRDECRQFQLSVEDLEANQGLQEAVLSAYHLMTILFEKGPATKLLFTDTGSSWAKTLAVLKAP